jgi:hypothetical protein
MGWIEQLYHDTKQKWEETGKSKSGYAIFYSPVKENVKIALIGYNPGGDERSFDPDNIKVPTQHEYTYEKYRLAEKVRKIFSSAGLNIIDTVKFNLIFFRSRKVNELTDKELIQFSEDKVIHILDQLKPQYIITEGFSTFERILTLKRGRTNGFEKDGKDQRLLLIGETEDNIKVLGMRHPSGARLSNEALEAMGVYLKKHLN